jgi:hypothetical protein
MRYFDFVMQSALILVALICVPLTSGDVAMGVIFGIQFLLSAWQFIGCMINLRSDDMIFDLKKRYIRIFSVFLLLIWLIMVADRFIVLGDVAFAAIFIGALILNIYYYSLTVRCAFQSRKNNGHFLPHIGF